MGNFVMAVVHLIMAIGAFGYKNPSLSSSFKPYLFCPLFKKHRTLTMLCDQMIVTNGGKAYGYLKNYKFSRKDAGVD